MSLEEHEEAAERTKSDLCVLEKNPVISQY